MAQNARNQMHKPQPRDLDRDLESRETDEVLESDVDETEGNPRELGQVLGSATGEGEDVIVAGGWAGTDDDTSTAPSDRIGLPEQDRLSELTGGAVSDRNPILEGDVEDLEDADELNGAIRNAEDRIVEGGRHPNKEV